MGVISQDEHSAKLAYLRDKGAFGANAEATAFWKRAGSGAGNSLSEVQATWDKFGPGSGGAPAAPAPAAAAPMTASLGGGGGAPGGAAAPAAAASTPGAPQAAAAMGFESAMMPDMSSMLGSAPPTGGGLNPQLGTRKGRALQGFMQSGVRY